MNLQLANTNFNTYGGIKNLSDQELLSRVGSLVRQERQIIEDLIWHLQEVQDRKLFISMGYTSLYDCLTKHFGYSEAVAYSRISALKMITAIPEAAIALNQGEVTLTTLSLTQSFIRKQEQQSGQKVSVAEKIMFLEAVKNKSTRDAKQTLATISPTMELPHDKINYLSADDIQLQITTDKSLLEKIERLKTLISHEKVDPTYSELLHMAFDAAIEEKEKAKGFRVKQRREAGKITEKNKIHVAVVKKSANENTNRVTSDTGTTKELKNNLNSITQGNSVKSARAISPAIKRKILERSNSRCEFIHPNGVRCESRFQLQFDHILAFSKGGTSDYQNIQNLCRVHNAYKSDR